MRFLSLPHASLAWPSASAGAVRSLPRPVLASVRRQDAAAPADTAPGDRQATPMAAAWSDPLPLCFRSEAFAEDLDDAPAG